MSVQEDLLELERQFWVGGKSAYLKNVDTRGSDDEPYTALVSSGYVQREGSWKLMFHQQTPLVE